MAVAAFMPRSRDSVAPLLEGELVSWPTYEWRQGNKTFKSANPMQQVESWGENWPAEGPSSPLVLLYSVFGPKSQDERAVARC